MNYAEPLAPGRERSLFPDAGLLSARFEDLDPDRVSGSVRAAAALAEWVPAAAAVAPDGTGGPASGLVLLGPTGTGKTHLLTAAARALCGVLPPEVSRSSHRVLLIGEAQLHVYARACWSRGESLPDRLRRAMSGANRSWLFLDDLGAARDDERWREEMADILLLRHGSPYRALTVISTNVPLSELEHLYGVRMASRLREMLLLYKLEGNDQRRPRRG